MSITKLENWAVHWFRSPSWLTDWLTESDIEVSSPSDHRLNSDIKLWKSFIRTASTISQYWVAEIENFIRHRTATAVAEALAVAVPPLWTSLVCVALIHWATHDSKKMLHAERSIFPATVWFCSSSLHLGQNFSNEFQPVDIPGQRILSRSCKVVQDLTDDQISSDLFVRSYLFQTVCSYHVVVWFLMSVSSQNLTRFLPTVSYQESQSETYKFWSDLVWEIFSEFRTTNLLSTTHSMIEQNMSPVEQPRRNNTTTERPYFLKYVP